MNDLFGFMYEVFFSDFNYCETLLYAMNDGREYTTIFLSTLVIVIVGVVTFYKLINPVRKQRLKWFVFLGTLTVIGFVAATIIVNENRAFIWHIKTRN